MTLSGLWNEFLLEGQKSVLSPSVFASFFFQANIMRYNEETLMKMSTSSNTPTRPQDSEETSSSTGQKSGAPYSIFSSKDLEMPMPPLALAPLQQQGIRYGFLVINSLLEPG